MFFCYFREMKEFALFFHSILLLYNSIIDLKVIKSVSQGVQSLPFSVASGFRLLLFSSFSFWFPCLFLSSNGDYGYSFDIFKGWFLSFFRLIKLEN